MASSTGTTNGIMEGSTTHPPAQTEKSGPVGDLGSSARVAGGAEAPKENEWKDVKSKSKKKNKFCIVEVLADCTKAPGVALKGLPGNDSGSVRWRGAKEVGRGCVSIRVDFGTPKSNEEVEEYKRAVKEIVKKWKAVKHEFKNKPFLKLVLSRTCNEFGKEFEPVEPVEYKFLGYVDKKKRRSKVCFEFRDKTKGNLTKEENAKMKAIFDKHYEEVERDDRFWTQAEKAGRTIDVDFKKFMGVMAKLKRTMKMKNKIEGLDNITPEILKSLMVVKTRFKYVDGKKVSQMMMGFEEGSVADDLMEEKYNYFLTDLTRYWAKRCQDWESVYKKKDAMAIAAQKAVRVIENVWMSRRMKRCAEYIKGACDALKKILHETSCKEDAAMVFLTRYDEQKTKDAAAVEAAAIEAEKKAAWRAEMLRLQLREVEKYNGPGELVVRAPEDDVWGCAGGAPAPKKSKKQKSKKQQKIIKVSLADLELRIDPADGNAYPRESFLQVYGETEGQARWECAPKKKFDQETEKVEVEAEVERPVEVESAAAVVETPPVEMDVDVLKFNSFAALDKAPREFPI